MLRVREPRRAVLLLCGLPSIVGDLRYLSSRSSRGQASLVVQDALIVAEIWFGSARSECEGVELIAVQSAGGSIG
jgi:hypothetical protein